MIRVNVRKLGYLLVFFIITMGILVQNSPSLLSRVAELGSFQETFDSTVYMDAGNSTVTGWGTGSLSSNNKAIELLASYDTLGNSRGVAIAGDLAYVADLANGLQIFNVSNPATPTLVGFYNTSVQAEDVFVSGDYVFVADTNNKRLWVINTSIPSTPTVIDFYVTPGNPMDVYVAGDYAFVADSDYGLQIINITDIDNLSLIGSYDTPEKAHGVFIDGDRAFIADGITGMLVIDISDIKNPSLDGSYNTPGYARDIVVDGDYAFIADSDYGLQIINIGDTSNPTLAGAYNTNGFSHGVFVHGDNVYVADENNGMVILDISDVSNPMLADSYNTPGSSYDIYVEGYHAYVADNNYGIHIITISESSYPRMYGKIDFPFGEGDVFVTGNYAYVIGNGSMQVVNVTNPEDPVIIGNCTTPGDSYNDDGEIVVSGNYAFIADGYPGGFQIANISDPKNPKIISSINSSFSAEDVVIAGDNAFIAGGGGLTIINITDVLNPSIIGFFDTPQLPRGVDVEGDIAVVVGSNAYSSQVIDISNPKNPSLLGNVSISRNAYDVCIEGDYAFIASLNTGLEIIDISNPKNPVLASTLEIQTRSEDIFIEGDLAYIAQNRLGLAIVNISDPLNPSREIGFSSGEDYVRGVYVSGEYAYLASDRSFRVVKVNINKYKVFQSPVIAQSSIIFTSPVDTSLNEAILTDISIKPIGSSISYLLSPDNGVHWEYVTPDFSHSFINNGNQLKWRAELINGQSSKDVTAEISSISIYYTYILDSPDSTASSGVPISDNTPFFDWENVPGAANYQFQLDTVTSFASSDFFQINLTSTSYTPSSPLSDAIWYWRVAAIDSSGVLGYFTENHNVTIDTQAPIINNPSDVSYYTGSSGNIIIWTPTDDHPFSYSISSEGVEVEGGAWNGGDISIDVDGLSIGSHVYLCTVDDSLNHSTSDTVIVTVSAVPTSTTTLSEPTSTTTLSGSITPGFELTVLLLVIFIATQRKKYQG